MPLSVQQFIENLSQTGLMSAAEVSTLCDRLPEADQPGDGEGLAKLLIRQGKLTKYQAQVIYSGKHQNLVFGEYVVLDKLGAGGMGVVLKARHRRMDRLVAIKVLPAATMKNRDAIERFYREVKAAAKLNHPNIVTAYDAGEHQGMHYLVMEYVDGRDLAAIIAEIGPLLIERAIDYILQAARGLEFAHARGVVHRDIKPANLLLSSEGQVKILDMGLARLSESPGATEATAAAQLTQSGQVMGTVDYMSPEQAMDTRTADHRADIYALGCTLYKLLTGQAVYDGDTMMKKLVGHRERPIPSLRTARPDVTEALDDIFQQMVAKRPEDRYQSMTEVIAALGVLRSGSTSALNAEATGVKSAGSSVHTTSRPTITAAEETITRQLDNTNAGVAAGDAPLNSSAATVGSASPSSWRSLNTRRLVLAALVVTACLAGVAWHLLPRDTNRNTHGIGQTNGDGTTPTPQLLTEGTQPGQEWSGNGLAMKFCWCPPGEFKMGEAPNQVDVTLTRGFWLGKYEVTQAEYRAVMKSNPSHFSAAGAGKDVVAGLDADKFPVEWLSWDEATEFCRAITDQERREGRLPAGWEYRLPTEAQWEYACRAGTQTAYSFGDVESRLVEFAWYESHSQQRTHEVGQKLPNALGLHDLHGNVWEWCRDAYQEKLPGGTDPEIVTEASDRVLRGGSWYDRAWFCRSAYRLGNTPGDRFSRLGFRLAAVQVAPSQASTPSSKPLAAGTKAGDEWSGNGLAMKFCWCPPGDFKMGEGKEAVDVKLTRGFWLGNYEVTQAEYRTVMKGNPSHFSAAGPGKDLVKELDADKLPVESVTWDEASEFCRALTEQEQRASRLPAGWEYRLPTEAQWEYACRAGTQTVFSSGDQETVFSEFAWHLGNSEKRAHEVGQKRANPWHLHDMHGNVFEWCRDWHQEKLPGGTDPEVTERASGRVDRGGSWLSDGSFCRSASRNWNVPDFRGSPLGFRVALVQSR